MRLQRLLHSACLATGVLTASVTLAQPAVTDPEGKAPVGSAPGTFPTTVTATNINAAPIAGSTIGGDGQDNILLSFPASGPVKWTSPRFNEGDVALSIGPFDPNDANYYPPNSHVGNAGYKPLSDGQAFANTTLAWRASQLSGGLFASVRHNGVDNGDLYSGGDVGTIHGIAYFDQTGASGWGYQMSTGELRNGGAGASDLMMGVAGFDQNLGEATFNAAAAFFPYEQGWTGAWVNGSNNATKYAASSPGLANDAVVWNGNLAQVTLPGVNSAVDGMLFVAPTHDGNVSNIAAAFPTAGGWSVAVREDEANDDGSTTLGGPDNSFQLLYVPYSASGLIGGQVNGTTGAMIHAEGDAQFDLARTATGQYAVTVYEADGVTKKDENDGMLMMSVSGTLPNNAALADRTFLSYEYDGNADAFVVESRSLTAVNSPNSENAFGDELSLTDTDFYFTWVDFANPLSPTTPIPGDFDDDQQVDGDDLTIWKGAFGGAGADADGDGDSDGADFLIWQRNFGTGVPTAVVAGAVPEPSTALLALMGVAGAMRISRRCAGGFCR